MASTVLVCDCKHILGIEQAARFVIDLATDLEKVERKLHRNVKLALAFHIHIVVKFEVGFMGLNLAAISDHDPFSPEEGFRRSKYSPEPSGRSYCEFLVEVR